MTTVQPNNREMVRVVNLLDDRITKEVFDQTNPGQAFIAWRLIEFQIKSNVDLIPLDEMTLELTRNWLNVLLHFIQAGEEVLNRQELDETKDSRIGRFVGFELALEDFAKRHRLFTAHNLRLLHKESGEQSNMVSDAQRRVHKRLNG